MMSFENDRLNRLGLSRESRAYIRVTKIMEGGKNTRKSYYLHPGGNY